jgi:hypothetical protein
MARMATAFEQQEAQYRQVLPPGQAVLALRTVRGGRGQIEMWVWRSAVAVIHCRVLLTLPLHDRRHAVDHHIQKAADDQAEQTAHPGGMRLQGAQKFGH